jgi:putative LysE/RhtB family amino acid efflux pump
MLYFLKSCLIGFMVAVPIGPVGLACIRKTIDSGLFGAIAIGLGAAAADSLYAVLATTGMSVLSEFLLENGKLLKLLGGVFLLYLAYQEIRIAYREEELGSPSAEGLGKLFITAFLLTLGNPMTLLAFLGLFTAFCNSAESYDLLLMGIGVFVGSMSWWILLGIIILKLRDKLSSIYISRSRYFSAALLVCFALFAFADQYLDK